MTQFPLSLDLIAQATRFIQNKVHHTPLEYSPALSDLLGTPVYLKLEAFQITGSFKVRGALFYLSTLTDAEKKRGVATCSAGNHGLGLAYAAKQIGIPCTVYVPQNVDQSKHDKIVALGATVIRSEFPGYDDTLAWAQTEVKKSGLHFISAFEDNRIMAGNGGTLAAEILHDMPDVQNVLFPVGGGGLSAGITFYLKEKNPSIQLIGCQHIDSAALKISLEHNKAATTLPPIETVAGGIEGGIGAQCFEILKTRINEVVLLTEEEICDAFRWVIENHHYLIEPTSAVTLAACLSHKTPKLRGKTVVLLTGRNVSSFTAQKLILEEGLSIV